MASPYAGHYQGDLRDLGGNALVGAVIEVRNAGSATAATLYNNGVLIAAATEDDSLGNSPVAAAAGEGLPGIDLGGTLSFHADAAQEYDLVGTNGNDVLGPFRVRVTSDRRSHVTVNELPRSPLQEAYGGAFTPAAVMAAAAGVAAVHLPVGTCTGPLSLPGGTVLTGVPGKSIIKAAAGAAVNLITNADSGPVTIIDVVIDGSKADITGGSAGSGIHLTSDGSQVRRCIIHDTRLSGVRIFNADDCAVEDNEFTDCGDPAQNGTFATNGVTLQGHRIRVQRNTITRAAGQGVGQSALSAGQTSGAIVHGNHIYDAGLFGIALGSFARDCEVTANYIDGSSDNSIDIGSTIGCKVVGNTCLNGFDGIDSDLSALTLGANDDIGLIITDNTIRGMGRYGIIVGFPSPATGLTVKGNKIDTVDLHGISLINVWRSVVEGNTIRDFDGNATALFCAIAFSGSCHHNMVMGNVGFETRVTPHGLGFAEQPGGSYDHNTCIGNDFSGTSAAFPTAANAGDIRLGNR